MVEEIWMAEEEVVGEVFEEAGAEVEVSALEDAVGVEDLDDSV